MSRVQRLFWTIVYAFLSLINLVQTVGLSILLYHDKDVNIVTLVISACLLLVGIFMVLLHGITFIMGDRWVMEKLDCTANEIDEWELKWGKK